MGGEYESSDIYGLVLALLLSLSATSLQVQSAPLHSGGSKLL